MLTREQNELLTRTGPGTPMGEVLRRYWVPALLSWELPEPDCPPVRVKLLGETLVAFRDTEGRVGILEELCAHRCASLWLGRNEENGLRCVFHGWKYDVTGQCVDMPNEPAQSDFKARIRVQAYPTVELGGIIWTFMGPADKRPPEPKFDFTQVPEMQRQVTKTWEECNWLQGLEGGIDTAHAGILHRVLASSNGRVLGTAGYWLSARAVEVEVHPSDYGYLYAGSRPQGENSSWVRAYHFVMPWTQIRPNQDSGVGQRQEMIAGHFWVPMDDDNHMVWNWHYRLDGPVERWDAREPSYPGGEQLPGFRKARNPDNQWLIDRTMQRTENFTGIAGINTQDHAVQESMGRLVDRSREHLMHTDKAVVTARLMLLKAIADVEKGDDPAGVAATYYGLRAIEDIVPTGTHWRDVLGPRLQVG